MKPVSPPPVDVYKRQVYASVYASKARVLRVRSTGAWVFRIPFPRTAIAGATRTVKLDAKELQGYADVCVSYTYTAMPGKMLVEASGDTCLLYTSPALPSNRL